MPGTWKGVWFSRQKRKVGGRSKNPPPGGHILRAGTGGGAAAATAATAVDGVDGIDGKAEGSHIYSNVAGLRKKGIVYAEGEAVFIKHGIGIVRLIQSQGQPGAASAAGGEIDPEGRLFLVREIRIQLAPGAFCYMHHDVPPENVRAAGSGDPAPRVYKVDLPIR